MKDGLLGFLDSPAGAGLLSAFAGGLAGARRGTPVNNVGRAGLAGLAGYSQANDDQLKMAELKRFNESRDLQQQQLQLQLKQTQRGFDRDTQVEDALRAAFKPATTGSVGFGVPSNSPQSQQLIEQGGTDNKAFNADMLKGLNSSLEFSNPGQAVPAQAPSAGGFDNKDFLDKYRQIDPIKAIQYEQALKRENAPVKVGKDDRLIDPLNFKELVGAAPEKIDYNKPFLNDGKPNFPYQQFKLRDSRSGAANTNNTISVAGPENKFNQVVGEGLGKESLASIDLAKGSSEIVRNAQSIRQALNNGAITGTGANSRLAVQKALETAGIVGPGQAASTQELIAGLGKLTLAGVKTSGLGSGNGFTDKDREFLQGTISGTVESTPENIRRVADLSERVATANHQKGSKVLERLKNNPALKNVAQDTQIDPLPAQNYQSAAAAELARRGKK